MVEYGKKGELGSFNLNMSNMGSCSSGLHDVTQLEVGWILDIVILTFIFDPPVITLFWFNLLVSDLLLTSEIKS